MRDYGEFRLRIVRGTEEGTYRVECSGLAGDGAGGFTVPFTDTELENFVLKVGRTRRGVRKIESPEMQLARKFGGQLFGAIMQGKTGELYRAASSEARATGQGLRITLSLTDVPELGGIPWEYLYDEPNFLSINAWTPVVRYLDLPKPRRALEMELPLRILGVISNPLDAEPLDVEVERAKLENALKPLTDANAVTIDWLEEPTLLALTKRLRPDTYHILHFIGHGGFDDANGEGALLFEDAAGRGRAVSGDQLAAVLYEKRSLRLVLLNSCEGARNSVQDPFSGVAASLVQREIPAVIGMQFEITDRAAVLFASEFYAMLAEGQPIDSAISEARLAIWADSNDVEWGTPVLFMRVADGRLFNVTHAATQPRPAPQDLPPKAESTVRDVAAAVAEPAPPVVEPPVVEPPPVVVEPAPPVVEPPPVITRSPPPVEVPPPAVEPPPPLVEPPPRPVVEPPPPVIQHPPPVAEPQPPVTKPAPEPTPMPPPPPRRVPWRWVIIGGIATFFALAVIGAFIPTEPESSAPPTTPAPRESGPPPSAAGAVVGPLTPITPGIAFFSNTDGDDELYNLDPLTGHIDQLTFNGLGDRYPAWSPDHTRLTFSRRVGQDSRDVFLHDLDNSDPLPLVIGDTWDWASNWSKDDWIAYVHGDPRELPSAIWAIRPDGSGAHEIISGTRMRGPAWSPDATALAIMAEGVGGAFDLYVVGADGAGPFPLTQSAVNDRDPAWAPNGTTIAFVGDNEIYLIDAGTKIVSAPLTHDNIEDGNPVWSPDGTQIAYVKSADSTHSHIWLMNADGSNQHDLTPDRDGKNMDLSWR